MQLRSGKSIHSGTTLQSKVSTQESGTREPPLAPIPEDQDQSDTNSVSIHTESSITGSVDSMEMGDTSGHAHKEHMYDTHYEPPTFNVQLAYEKDNVYGAHIYVDPLNNHVVKMGPDQGLAKPEGWVMAMYQDDRYINEHGVVYLITPSYEHMNCFGVIMHRGAYSEPDHHFNERMHEDTRRTRTEFPDRMPEPPIGEPEVSSAPNVSCVPVARILSDQEHVVLYRNHVGLIYSTPASPTQFYPFKNIINVYSNLHGNPIVLEDDYRNIFHIVGRDEISAYTWEGVPIQHNAVRANFANIRKATPAPPKSTNTTWGANSPRPRSADLHHHDHRHDHGSGERRDHSGEIPSAPAMPEAPLDHLGGYRPERIRGRRGDSVKGIRPSTLQKFCKKFNGSGDPYDHIAQYRQLIFAEGITDVHTMVQAFGLTMEGRALAWFQTLKPSVLYDFEVLVKRFIEAHSKIGIKHNTVTLILNFKRNKNETVRECIDRLRKYIARCPSREMPNQERLISCFLEGLDNEQLYTQLFAKNHTDFDECCYNAQKLDDNCEWLRNNNSHSTSSRDERDKGVDTNALADALWRRMKLEQRNTSPYRPHPMRTYVCERCSGPHPTDRCPNGNLKWCDICVRMGNHETSKCFYCPKYEADARESGERAKPVLGNQPPIPGTTGVRYAEPDELATQELVPAGAYYDEEYPIIEEYGDDYTRPLMIMGMGRGQAPEGFVRKLPMGTCYNCQGDHYIKDCPHELKPRFKEGPWPKVLRFCADCGIEHLARDCPKKPPPQQPGKTVLNYIEPVNDTRSESQASLRVITRAQARNKAERVTSQEETLQPKKRMRKRWVKERIPETRTTQPPQAPLEPQLSEGDISKTSSGGSVLMEKVNENLEALLKAFDARIKPDTVLPKELKEYPNPMEEKRRLADHSQLIRDTQTQWEGDINPIVHRPQVRLKLEPIMENESLKQDVRVVPDSESDRPLAESLKSEVQEQLNEELWDELRTSKRRKASFSDKTAPISIVGSSVSLEQGSEPEVLEDDRRSNTLATLPSYLGQRDDQSVLIPIPSPQINCPKGSLDELVERLMTQKFRVELTLKEIAELKPDLWQHLAGKLSGKPPQLRALNEDEVTAKQELCKMSQYVKTEGDKGNTTLRLQVNGVTTTAILDTGAGVSIITKPTWLNWGRKALVKTRMGLQLVDGEVKYPMGMLEEIDVNICGIPFQHSFAVVDFAQDTNYDVILGRPFMRQMLVVQDWGYNRLYL